jgi:hypothetical protein
VPTGDGAARATAILDLAAAPVMTTAMSNRARALFEAPFTLDHAVKE